MSESSFSLTTFSPSGKLIQIEYALNRVMSGAPALGIKARNGVVIATEKKLSSVLIDETSIHKVEILNEKVGCVYAGMPADYRVVLKKARKKAQAYKQSLREPAPVEFLVKQVAEFMQEFTHSGGVRPFGISLLVAGMDSQGPQLYQVDPSGAVIGWKASAIGRDMQNSKTFLEKRYSEEIEIEDAIHTAILTLKEGFEGAMTENDLEIGVIGNDGVFKIFTPSEIRDYLGEVE